MMSKSQSGLLPSEITEGYAKFHWLSFTDYKIHQSHSYPLLLAHSRDLIPNNA